MKILRSLLILFLLPLVSTAQNAKLDWVFDVGTGYLVRNLNVDSDNDGNWYVSGGFGYDLLNSTIDLDHGPKEDYIRSNGQVDIYTQKMNRQGEVIWTKSIGGQYSESIGKIKVDNDGNVFTSGISYGNVDYDPGPGTHFISSKANEVFVQKLDNDGEFKWAQRHSGAGRTSIRSMVVDVDGNLYLAGGYYGEVDYYKGQTGATHTSNGKGDIYIQKYDKNGNFAWVRTIGGSDVDQCKGMDIDQNNNLIVMGTYRGNVDFDPGPGSTILTGGTNINNNFIMKLDSSGALKWAKNYDHTSVNQVLTVDGDNNILIAGLFFSTQKFARASDTVELSAYGHADVHVHKLDPNGVVLWASQLGGTAYEDPYSIAVDQSNNVYVLGIFEGKTDFDPSSDSAFLTVNNNSRDIFLSKLNSSGQYAFAEKIGGKNADDGVSLSALNVQDDEHILIAARYADSVDFGINTKPHYLYNNFINTFIMMLSTCDKDSSTQKITSCDPYTWIDGITYSSSTNEATMIYNNVSNCDSIVRLDLTIFESSDRSTKTANNVITANNLSATYQWLDCDDNYAIISGENSASYAPTKNGNYAVELTENGCKDTSDCVAMAIVGTTGPVLGDFNIYPNPAGNLLRYELPANISSSGILEISNNLGLLVHRAKVTSKGQIDISFLSSGVYIITLEVDGATTVKRLMVRD